MQDGVIGSRTGSDAARDAMIERDTLVAELAAELRTEAFNDYCPNGLQVEGRREIRRIVTGVTASQALIDAAIAVRADALIVHHGYFWKHEPQPIVGMKARRIAALLQHGINLLAYHLPLDAHPEFGNNACLGRALGFSSDAAMRPDGVGSLGRVNDGPLPPEALSQRLARVLGRAPLWIDSGGGAIERVAWCTGGAQSLLTRAAELGAQAYISGEISEQTTHEARELGVHYFAAGHHATERGGPSALGEWIAARFGLAVEFIDMENPA